MMFWRRKTRDFQDRADSLTRLLLREAGLTDDEVDRIAVRVNYSGVRARIDRKSMATPRLEMAVLASPAMLHAAAAAAVVALIAAGVFWFFEPRPNTTSLDSLLTGLDVPVASRSGRACALSTYKGCSLSREEVLETIVAKNAREGMK